MGEILPSLATYLLVHLFFECPFTQMNITIIACCLMNAHGRIVRITIFGLEMNPTTESKQTTH